MGKDKILRFYKLIIQLIWVILGLIILIPVTQFIDFEDTKKKKNISPITQTKTVEPKIIDGKDVETGFIVDEGREVVKTNCTACHNSKIILQNQFSKEGWKELIVWMQETQGLWQLGDNEEIILNYLSKNYAPTKKGRRVPLEVKEEDWYILE